MAKSLFDPSWYRVADLRVRLRGHAEIHRQRFRGELWYILQDHQTGRFHRLSPAANLMIALMDGRRTLDEIWNLVGSKSGDDPPTQDETIRLLAQMHSSDLLQGEVPPDFAELTDRSDKQARSAMMSRLRNPLALRLPLLDPDRFLEATMPFIKPLFTVWGFLAWLALVGAGITLAVLNWSELTADSSDRLLSAGNLLLIAAIYPVVKTLHEAGHAYATKAFGGAVHEVGIMLLVMLPAPYVDATSSTAFREKWLRMIVSGAGIMVEFGLAAIAMIFWVNAEPGLARAIAFNVMLIGGVSTVFFNGNPLLRFDGYYILTDLIEIPNFGARANKYFWYLVQRHLLGIETAESPAESRGERSWLFFYAVLAFCYRVGLSLSIALLVASQLFFIGVALALFSLYGSFGSPLVSGAKFLMSPRLAGNRNRALAVTGIGIAALAGLLFLLPVPYSTIVQGVVWAPDGAEVRSGTAGMVAEILAPPDSIVAAGTPLLRLADPTLEGRVALLEAQRQELQLRSEAARFDDRVQSQVLLEQLRNIEGVLAATNQRAALLVVSAAGPGRFVLPSAASLIGRSLEQGDLVGYVVPDATPHLRVAVAQDEVDLIRGRTRSVDLRYVSDLSRPVVANVVREVPAASLDLPSLALSVEGGGEIAVAGRNGDIAQALQGLFVFDVEPAEADRQLLLGSRAYVRFNHGDEAIAWRLLRSLRQLFLARFDV